MRDLVFVFAVLAGIGAGLVSPFAAILVWTWLSVMSPQVETFGFAQTLPLNLVVAIVAIGGLILSRERKLPIGDGLIWLSCAFLAWCTFNGFVAVDPDWSWPYWDRTWKIFALGLLVATAALSRARIHALVWMIVVSLFYYGVKGGVFTLMTGGGGHVYGPASSIIGDNNQLALALLMALPLANYLRSQSANRWVRNLLLLGMGLTVVAILGTYSRGGFIGLAVLCIAGWTKVRRKFAFLVITLMVMVPALMAMPASFYQRLQSIHQYDTDSSFQGRVKAWHVAYDYARDHFPFGAGFYGPQRANVFHLYYPDEMPHAAHSIYFQVLGEQGFVGLALYLALLGVAFVKSFRLARRLKSQPGQQSYAELVGMMQLSLLVFCLSGAALSMAYYDVFIIFVGMLVALRAQTAAEPSPLLNRRPLVAAAASAG
jgi:probable O-glycosylation ligase (exosortase A-associated)